MASAWPSEQVMALSPTAVAVRRGQTLANAAKWSVLGAHEQAVWGECEGRGKALYRTIVDLSGPAFRCSCSSRQFPCKHAIGLFLLLTEQALFPAAELPAWVEKWLVQRRHSPSKGRSHRQVQTAMPTNDTKSSADAAIQTAQAQKRFEKRAAKVEAGLIDLEQWLQDLLRSGLADLPAQPYRFWDQAATRLVDAQAPGLARRVRALASIPNSGSGWPERMLKALGQLYVLVQSYRQLDILGVSEQSAVEDALRAPSGSALRAQILTQIGFTQKQEDLFQRSQQPDAEVLALSDTWQVLGKVVTEEDSLKTQRVWLWGMQHRRAALVLSFAHGRRQQLDNSLVPGTSFRGQLVFYPGTGVQRAFVASREGAAEGVRADIGAENVEDAIAHYAQSLTENPWQTHYPLVLSQVVLRYESSQWWLQDAKESALPIAAEFTQGWSLLAMSGGRPLSVFGEWDGDTLQPLSVWSEKKFMALHNSGVR
ncbi:MAG: SWIM zinc finger family protein [Cyanobacteria bacterium J06649_4]